MIPLRKIRLRLVTEYLVISEWIILAITLSDVEKRNLLLNNENPYFFHLILR